MNWLRSRRRVRDIAYPVRTYAYNCPRCGVNLRRTIAADPPWIMPCSRCGREARRKLV